MNGKTLDLLFDYLLLAVGIFGEAGLLESGIIEARLIGVIARRRDAVVSHRSVRFSSFDILFELAVFLAFQHSSFLHSQLDIFKPRFLKACLTYFDGVEVRNVGEDVERNLAEAIQCDDDASDEYECHQCKHGSDVSTQHDSCVWKSSIKSGRITFDQTKRIHIIVNKLPNNTNQYRTR